MRTISRETRQEEISIALWIDTSCRGFTAEQNNEGEVLESLIGRRLPHEIKVIAVMERQEGWDDQYPEALKVGDWEFELFSTTGENLNKDMTSCRECHAPHHEHEFVFSLEQFAAARVWVSFFL